MAEIEKLVYATSIDSSGWFKGLDEGQKGLEAFHDSAVGKLDGISIGGPSIDLKAGMDSGGMASAFLPLASKIQSALHTAVGPLTVFAAEFRSQFAEVGATVEKLSVRIDDAMRFPMFLKRVDAFRASLLSRFGLTMRQVGDQAEKSLQVEADATKLVGSYQKARDQIKKTVAPIPRDIGYALQAAVHVDAKGSFASYLAGLDEVSSSAIDKMKHMASAVANATGKGSRKGRWKARDQATALDTTINSVPARQNASPATSAPGISAWQMLGKAATAAGTVAKAVHQDLSKLARQDARDVDRVIAAWRKFEQVKATLSTFGSVANATFGKLSKLPTPKLAFDPRQGAVIKGIGSAAQSAGGGLKSFADQAGLALGLFGFAFKAVNFFKEGAAGASNLAETMNRVDVSLGTGAPKVKAFADELQTRFGIAKNTSLDTAASFAGLGKSLGRLNGEKLTGFSTQFTMMAADLSSFANIDVAQAGDALRTALSGNQSDTLKELGVVLTEDTLKTYAYTHGIAAANTELNEQQKFAARTALITAGLSRVHGDLAKTQGGAANQGRKFMGTIQNIGVSIGTAMLPALTSGLELLNEFGSWASKTFDENKTVVQGWSEAIIGAFDYVIAVVHNFPAAFQVARIKVGEVLTNIGEYLAVLGPNAAIVAEYIGKNWLLLIGDAFDATLTMLGNLWTNFQKIGKAIFDWFQHPTESFKVDWTPLLDGFRATADEFPKLLKPALTDMSKEMAEAAKPITGEVASRRAKRAMPAAGAQLVDTPVGDEALKGKDAKSGAKSAKDNELKFAGALELGSKEAYSSVVSATSGRTKGMDELNRSSRDTASNTARMANALEKQGGRNQRPQRLEIA